MAGKPEDSWWRNLLLLGWCSQSSVGSASKQPLPAFELGTVVDDCIAAIGVHVAVSVLVQRPSFDFFWPQRPLMWRMMRRWRGRQQQLEPQNKRGVLEEL